MKQVRIAITELTNTVSKLLKREIQFADLISQLGEAAKSEDAKLTVEKNVESNIDKNVSSDSSLIKLDEMEKILK